MKSFVMLVLRLLIFELVLGGVLFASAGRLDLPWFWAVIVIHAMSMAVAVPRIDPELRKERFSPGPGGQDRRLRLIALPIVLVHLVVAGLDAGRFHWSGEVAVPMHAAGLVVYMLGLWLALWAMSANRFFSPVVRIQKERGHEIGRLVVVEDLAQEDLHVRVALAHVAGIDARIGYPLPHRC